MARSAGGSPFATFLIIGPVCFFLGILYASFPYDYYVLWSTPPTTPPPYPTPFPAELTTHPNPNATLLRTPYLSLLEHHLKILHNSPPLISRILHIAIGTGLIGLVSKLYKPTEANMLFDGASLVLYMCGVTVYITNLVKGMRVVSAGTYGQAGADLAASRYDRANADMAVKQAALDSQGLGAQGDVAKGGAAGDLYIGREDSLKVLAASNTILALVLVGVLILQAGQWYAQKKEVAELEEMDRVREEKGRKVGTGGSGSGSGAAVEGVSAGGESAKKRR